MGAQLPTQSPPHTAPLLGLPCMLYSAPSSLTAQSSAPQETNSTEQVGGGGGGEERGGEGKRGAEKQREDALYLRAPVMRNAVAK